MKKIISILIPIFALSCSHQPTASEKTADNKAAAKESRCNEFRKVAAPQKFTEFDVNKDNRVEHDEYICLTMKRFSAMDKDSDLFLSKKELKNAGKWKTMADQNGDSKVSMIEYSYIADVGFTTVDQNKDGALSDKEVGEGLP